MWSVKCGVKEHGRAQNTSKCRSRNVNTNVRASRINCRCGVSNVNCKVWSVECGV